jgi:1-deoxy-D-xylulose-5-phosphate synthase
LAAVTEKLLQRINSPADLAGLSAGQLDQLCAEVRDLIISTVRRNGGHLAPSLGVVELTVALHHAFQSPRDKLIWDVGHQCYAHKILTGRRDQFPTVRTYDGLSGFCRRCESAHDPFGAGHASTSISAALGIAAGRDARGEDFSVIAVIGDGGLSGGLAFEGLDNAGASERNLVVILNDNNMSISPSVGALSRHLTDIITHPLFERAKKNIWDLTEKLPRGTRSIRQLVRRIEGGIKWSVSPPGVLFENLGFRYLGPIDGHKLGELIPVLQRVKQMHGPVLVHVLTQKGKGLADAENNPRKFHGIAPLKTDSDKVEKGPALLSYTQVFGKAVLEQGDAYPKLEAITAAMCDGTGLTEFAEKYPARFHDCGIAEGHATTFAGGLATEGVRPVFVVYSTFLQRAVDHLIHDIALQDLPVIFAIDRAGLVGEDGATHHGVFDLTYLGMIPNMVVAAPRNGKELRDLLATALAYTAGPFAIRYPRAPVPDREALIGEASTLQIGKWEKIRNGADCAILAVGTMVDTALTLMPLLVAEGLDPMVINARFIKPADEEMLAELNKKCKFIVTLEENTLTGGFGSQTAAYLAGQPGGVCPLLQVGLPDRFVEHGTREQLFERLGLLPTQIAGKIIQFAKQVNGKEQA